MTKDNYAMLKLNYRNRYKKWVIMECIADTAETAAGAKNFKTYKAITEPDTWIGTAYTLGGIQRKADKQSDGEQSSNDAGSSHIAKL